MGDKPSAAQNLSSPFPGGRMRQRDLFAISAYWFATNFHWGALLMIIMPSQIEQIIPEYKAKALGFILGIGAWVALVLPPIAGAFSDRCASRWGRRRPYMVTGVAVNLCGLFMMWSAGNLRGIWLYLIAYLFVQFGNNLATAAYSGVIPDLVPKEQRGEASGWMAAMVQTGTIFGAFSSGYMMDAGYVAGSYALIAVTLVLFLSITVVGMKEQPLETHPPPTDWLALFKTFWIDLRKYPDFAWVWVTRALVTLGMWTVQPHIQYYLGDVIGVEDPEKQTGLLLGIALVGATVSSLIGGKVSDRIGRKRVVYLSNTIIAVVALGFPFSHSLTTVYVLGTLYGLGFGAYYSVDWALACDVLPRKEDAAKDMGIWHISMVLPQTIAPFIAGPLLAYFGQSGTEGRYTLTGYTVICSLAAFFLLLGAVLLRNVRGVR